MSVFKFKQFEIKQDKCAMKIGTDGVLLGAWANIAQASSILDIGTGTGVLALMAAQRNSKAKISAIEIEENAFNQASENIHISPWANRVSASWQSLQEFTPNSLFKFDSIITNPPYFDINSSTKVKEHKRSLARSTEQLDFSTLLDCSQQLLTPQGNLSLILPKQEGKVFINLAQQSKWYLRRLTKVFPREGKLDNRSLIELVLYKTETKHSSIVIRHSGKNQHNYTESFISLHKEFYLHF